MAIASVALPAAAEGASPRKGLIAYQLQEAPQTCDQCGGNAESETVPGRSWIETIRSDGSQRRRLRCSSGPFSSCEDASPAFARDGRRLAIVGKGGLLIMRPSGRRLLRLRTMTGYSASWSPDGRRIAYTDVVGPLRQAPGGATLFGVHITDLAGRSRAVSAMDSGVVSWSASNRLAWDTTTDDAAPDGDIWVGDRSGRLRRLVLRRATRPRWSYDGGRLGFFCRGGLCVSRADGSGRRLLTRACELRPVDVTSASGFAWSPDGRWIACASKRGSLITVHVASKQIRLVRRASDLTFAAQIGAIDWQRSNRK